MQKNLVIVESPGKVKKIQSYLGSDYKVMSCIGHIRDLKKKNFGVDLETFEPQYEISADKRHVVSELRAEAKKCENVWLASDEDREGEAIAWHLAEVLGLDPNDKRRIVFHEITKPALLQAVANPRHIDLNLVDAQQARRVLDRLVGFKLSPILWRRVQPNLSAGRVQSVVVRLVVEREREIQKFKPQSGYRVTAVFGVPAADGGTVSVRAELNKRFDTQQEARQFLEDCKQAAFTIDTIQTRPAKRTPAPPFTTSTLQQEAASKLHYPVAMTMRVAQSLYESGHITYMRTDSMNLSELCLNSCGPVIERLMGANYHQRRTYHTRAKGAQEAHEAIRPTDMTKQTIVGTTQEKRLYELIWKRTLACQMADAKLERTTVNIKVGGREEHFQANGEVVLFDGFMRVYSESLHNEDEASAEARPAHLLPPMTEGETLEREEIMAQQRYTQAPPRYAEKNLVRKMEEMGIGRPSTYASTISTIQQRKYVEKNQREATSRNYEQLTLTGDDIKAETLTENVGGDHDKLVPTDVGLVVNDFLMECFPEIMDYNFTANVEKELDEVAEGQMNWTKLISTFYGDFDPQVERTMNAKTNHRVGERELGIDPKTGKPVSVKIGRYGPVAQLGATSDEEKPAFANLQAGQSIESITLEEALELFKLPRILGEFEGETLKANTGRFGPYVQMGKQFVSIPKEESPMSITLERAVELIKAKREAEEKSRLKTFAEEPDLEIKAGRWGPYIVYKKKNYKIPAAEAEHAADLTLDDCKRIIAEGPKKTAATRRSAAKVADEPAETAKTAKPAKAAKTTKPTKAAKSAKTTKPAKSAKK